MDQHFVPFYGQIIIHGVPIPPFEGPLISPWHLGCFYFSLLAPRENAAVKPLCTNRVARSSVLLCVYGGAELRGQMVATDFTF